jgi:hypothetical protein
VKDNFSLNQPYISYFRRVLDSFSIAIGKVLTLFLVVLCGIGLIVTHAVFFLIFFLIMELIVIGVCFLLGSIDSRTFLKEISIEEKIVLKTYIFDKEQADIVIDPEICFAVFHTSGNPIRKDIGLCSLEISSGNELVFWQVEKGGWLRHHFQIIVKHIEAARVAARKNTEKP